MLPLLFFFSGQCSDTDIHNRILRFKNFSIAMINKKVLPVQFEVPLLGKRLVVSVLFAVVLFGYCAVYFGHFLGERKSLRQYIYHV